MKPYVVINGKYNDGILTVRNTTSKKYVDTYYDTKDFALTRQNIWVVGRQNFYCNDHPKFMVTIVKMNNARDHYKEKSLEAISKKYHIELHEFARFNVTKYKFMDKSGVTVCCYETEYDGIAPQQRRVNLPSSTAPCSHKLCILKKEVTDFASTTNQLKTCFEQYKLTEGLHPVIEFLSRNKHSIYREIMNIRCGDIQVPSPERSEEYSEFTELIQENAAFINLFLSR